MTTSAIITAYNLEKYIRQAIDSVLAQTRLPDEIIVVDDCSTDRTAEIIQSYGDRVSYLRLPQNSGGLSATFYGLRHAKGDILFFLDGDDLWMPEKIESQLPLFTAYPDMAIVSHDYIRVNANREPMEGMDETQRNIDRILKTCSTVEAQSEAYKDSILGKKGYWGGSAYALRKRFVPVEKFEAWRSSFPYIRNTYLDMVLPTFMLVEDPTMMVGYADRKLFEYRIHGSNTSGNTLPSVEAARKAVRMIYGTTLATYGMLSEQPVYASYAGKQRLHVVECEYYDHLYDNKKWTAVKEFGFLSRKLWPAKRIFKELQRLTISVVLGPQVFVKLKNKLVKS